MSIPDSAIIMMNDTYGTETVAYATWADLRRDFLATFDDMTPEDLDELERQPEQESMIYSVDLEKQENATTGIYRDTYARPRLGMFGPEERRGICRIYWYDDYAAGQVSFSVEEEEEED